MSDELIERMQAGTTMEMILRGMFRNAEWVMEACSEFRVTAYPKTGGQLVTLVAPDWGALQDIVYTFLLGREAKFAEAWDND